MDLAEIYKEQKGPRSESSELISSSVKEYLMFLLGGLVSSILTFDYYLEFEYARFFYASISILTGLILIVTIFKINSKALRYIVRGLIVISSLGSCIYLYFVRDELIGINDDFNSFISSFFVYFICAFVSTIALSVIFAKVKSKLKLREIFSAK